MRHNHITRDIKQPGKCAACDEYHNRQVKKLFTESDFLVESPTDCRIASTEECADIANEKTAQLQAKYEKAIAGLKEIHADGSYEDIAAEITRRTLKECGEL